MMMMMMMGPIRHRQFKLEHVETDSSGLASDWGRVWYLWLPFHRCNIVSYTQWRVQGFENGGLRSLDGQPHQVFDSIGQSCWWELGAKPPAARRFWISFSLARWRQVRDRGGRPAATSLNPRYCVRVAKNQKRKPRSKTKAAFICHSSHLIWPHFIRTECDVKRPSLSWLRPIRTNCLVPTDAAAANWVAASQRTQPLSSNGRRSREINWDEWRERYLSPVIPPVYWVVWVKC